MAVLRGGDGRCVAGLRVNGLCRTSEEEEVEEEKEEKGGMREENSLERTRL